MKKILFGLLGLLIVVAGGAYIFSLQAGNMMKTATEKYGPRVLGAHVALENADVSILGGRASLTGFVIDNPSGFPDASAFKSEEIDVSLDVMSLFSEPVVIHSVRVQAPTVQYEIRRSGNNIGTLQKNAENAAADVRRSLGMEDESPPRTIIIERLTITSGEVIVAASELNQRVRVGLPDITLENLGGSSGAAVESVMAAVMKAVQQAAAEAIASGEAKKLLKEIVKDPGKVEDKVRGMGEKIEEGLGGSAEEGIKNLLNR